MSRFFATPKELAAACILLLAALLLLGQSLSYGLMSDDFYLMHRLETEGFFSSWGGESNSTFFRPLTVATYRTDNLLWEMSPTGYHLTNILWHLLCSVLVSLLAFELSREKVSAFLAGYLFILMACHSESVAWISGRTDLIATAFALLSVLMFLKKSYFAAPVFAVGLLAKESVIVIPLIWFLFGISRSTLRSRENIVSILSGVLVWILYIGGRIAFSSGFPAGLESVGISLQSLPEVFGNIVRYSFRVFAPPLPAAFRPFVLSHAFTVPIVLAGICSAMWIIYRKKSSGSGKQILLFAGCFLLSLAPVMLMKVSLFDSRSERFLYLPGVFAVLLLVKWTFAVFNTRRRAALFLILFSLLQGVFLYRSFRNWQIAGEMCKEIVLSGTDEIPDNYNGAYVFRNGYEEAILLLE